MGKDTMQPTTLSDTLEPLRTAQRQWSEESLQRAPQKAVQYITASDIPLVALATPLDWPEDLYLSHLGFPGAMPYTRGVQPTMYRGRLWTTRIFSGFGTAQETNQRYKYLLAQGNEGLSVAFDLPALYGYDADHPMAAGEVGKCGVAVSSLADMEMLFDGIPLEQVSTSMTITSTAAIALAMYVVVAEKQGVAPAQLRGTVQNDILKEYIAQKEWIFPPRPSLRLVRDSIAYCAEHLPQWNAISISGYHIREAGATAVQELAFTLYDGLTYVEESQQPYNNIVRVALQALAAVLGGTQSLHTNALDEALALPTEEAARIALRTQQIIAHESGVAETIDPFGGSYYLEKLTDELEQRVYAYFRKLDELGGMVRAIELGFPQREISEAAYRYQQKLEKQEEVIVGVNDFVSDEAPIEILQIEPRVEQEQIAKLRHLRQGRDNVLLRKRLEKLETVAKSDANIMPAIVDVVRAYGTIGEIADVLRSVWGIYEEETSALFS